jgi:hypothetical protein
MSSLQSSEFQPFEPIRAHLSSRRLNYLIHISLYEEDRYFLVWSSTLCTLSSTNVLDQTRKYLSFSYRDIKYILAVFCVFSLQTGYYMGHVTWLMF